jgi:hypothetical protein
VLDPSLQIMTNLKEGNLEDAMDKCTNAVTELASPQKSMSMGGGGVGAVAKRALLEAQDVTNLRLPGGEQTLSADEGEDGMD